MWALCLILEFCEVIQADPLGLIATASAHWAGDMTGVFTTLAVLGFAHRQVSLAVAVLAFGKNLYFDHQ
jgi:hypothetical protein